jgi:transposase-like protein
MSVKEIIISGNIKERKDKELTYMHYNKELKESIIRRMLPPSNEAISKISKEEGISEQTLRNWRVDARANGVTAPASDFTKDRWSTQDKFLIVVETASMNETELAEYARLKGLYVEEVKAWRDACMNANGGIAKEATRLNKELKISENERKQLEKELRRKEKALAETAALLVLIKKANAIWGEPEDE